MTIYIDIVIIENLIMNYIILLATGVVTKSSIKSIRLIFASLLGAVYSVLAYSGILKVYSNIVMKILLSVIIIYVAFNPKNKKKMWKTLVIFYLISFAFGGAAYALIYIVKPKDIIMKNGLFLGTYPLKSTLLGGIIVFTFIIITFKSIKRKFNTKDITYKIEIRINEKEIKTNALIDTGNMLKEPITGTPVIIVEKVLLYDCMPKEILNNLEEIIGGDFEKIPKHIQTKYISKLKLIPFSSLGKENGILLGIKPEEVVVTKDEEKITYTNIIIGIYNKSLTKNGEYQSLMGMEFI